MWAQLKYDTSSRQGPIEEEPSASPAGTAVAGAEVGHIAGTLGPAPTAAAEEPTAVEGLAAAMSAAEEPGGSKRGVGGRGRRALAHPRSEGG